MSPTKFSSLGGIGRHRGGPSQEIGPAHRVVVGVAPHHHDLLEMGELAAVTEGNNPTLPWEFTLLDSDGVTPVADTSILTSACSVPTVCGAGCPEFRRRLPFTRTYFLAVRAVANDACGGGAYRLVVVSPGGATPTLVADDVDP